MQDSTATVPAPTSPQPSIPSSVAAPIAAYPSTPTISAPASYPTAVAPAAVSYPSAPEAQAAASQANPWQQAYQGLLASLSAPQASQPQAPSWLPTPQAAPVAAYPQASYLAAPSVTAPLTSMPQATPAYSQAMPQAAPSWNSAPSAPASDEYLASVSGESLEVLQHFGAEAPALLNRYACVVEDALLAQARQTAEALQHLQAFDQQLQDARTVITAAAEDNAAYHTLLSNPDLLANYVNEFFGPEGPYPTETMADRLAAEVAANEQRYTPVAQPAPTFQRPQLDMPAPSVQVGGGDDFWGTFSALMDQNPAAASQFLAQAATPEALRSKILVSEG